MNANLGLRRLRDEERYLGLELQPLLRDRGGYPVRFPDHGASTTPAVEFAD